MDILYLPRNAIRKMSNAIGRNGGTIIGGASLYLWQQLMPGDASSNFQLYHTLTGGNSSPRYLIRGVYDFAHVIVTNPKFILPI